jgi:hypothetical protein
MDSMLSRLSRKELGGGGGKSRGDSIA